VQAFLGTFAKEISSLDTTYTRDISSPVEKVLSVQFIADLPYINIHFDHVLIRFPKL
jgi:hypothetical protein